MSFADYSAWPTVRNAGPPGADEDGTRRLVEAADALLGALECVEIVAEAGNMEDLEAAWHDLTLAVEDAQS